MSVAWMGNAAAVGQGAPWWLPSGHAQTIWAALAAAAGDGPAPRWRRERWTTPDGDFIDVDFVADPPSDPDAPLLVLFHGLEGSSASHYARAFAHWARSRGWGCVVPHFRGCSGEINLAPRAYHSGDFEEIGWILARLRSMHGRPLLVAGVSLGGNALLRWAEEAGESASDIAHAVAAISAPLDLTAGGTALSRGFSLHVYTRMFLRTMIPKALAKWAQHPGLFKRERLLSARTLYDFDDAFTAPLHGFRDADDYWTRASSKPQLARIRVPTLVLNARNDPFVPASSLPQPHEVGPWVTLWQPATGGHVGFANGCFPGRLAALPEAVGGWLSATAP